MKFGTAVGALAIGISVAWTTVGARPQMREAHLIAAPNVDDLIHKAFEAAYNLDLEEAKSFARQAVTADPNVSETHRTLASVLWLEILYKRGALTVDNYMGSVSKPLPSTSKPPPQLVADFLAELQKTIDLAEARIKRTPNDIEARHEYGQAYAVQASYLGSVEGSVVAAFRAAKRAFDAQEAVLERQPNRANAIFVIGVYRYAVSVMSLPSRVIAYIAGFGGGKERAISMLEQAASMPETHFDASAALLLIYTREGRHLDAFNLCKRLEPELPHNRILVLEEGAAAIRAGRAAEAEAILTRGLQAFDLDPRPKMPGEKALWFYKRGVARLNQNHLQDARLDLWAAQSNKPLEWLAGRTHLQLGKIEDLTNNRKNALGEYRQARLMCSSNNDPICADEAERLISKPFTFPK